MTKVLNLRNLYMRSLDLSAQRRSSFSVGKLSLKFALWGGMALIASCSLEKELPIVCVSEDKKITVELCREYRRGGLDGDGKNDLLGSYGFNKRDVQAIYSRTSEESVRCKTAVVKQCDLIMLRNGVGY